MDNVQRIHPVIILPPDEMKPEDIERLRANGFCVVECTHPEKVKFLDPIPAVADRTQIENAAIQLSRRIMSKNYWTNEDTRRTVTATFFDILIKGTPLDPLPSQEEREQKIFNDEKEMEVRRLAREEAKAERAAKKAATTKQPAK